MSVMACQITSVSRHNGPANNGDYISIPWRYNGKNYTLLGVLMLSNASGVTLIVNDVHFHWLWIRFIDTLILHLEHNLGILYRWIYARLQGCSISIANALVLLQSSLSHRSQWEVRNLLLISCINMCGCQKDMGMKYINMCVYLRNSFHLDMYL